MAKAPSFKANQNSFGRMAAQAARECHTFFFCGPDESAASAAAATIVGGLPDPGERVDMSGSDLRRDPVRLADEARKALANREASEANAIREAKERVLVIEEKLAAAGYDHTVDRAALHAGTAAACTQMGARGLGDCCCERCCCASLRKAVGAV